MRQWSRREPGQDWKVAALSDNAMCRIYITFTKHLFFRDGCLFFCKKTALTQKVSAVINGFLIHLSPVLPVQAEVQVQA